MRKINLFIFNEKSVAAVYGIGTYVNELLYCLKGNKEINVNIITLKADTDEFKIENNEGVTMWYIPSNIRYEENRNLYHKSVINLLKLYINIECTKDMIVHINYLNSLVLAQGLKSAFGCKILVVVHYLEWSFELNGNLMWLRAILKNGKMPESLVSELSTSKKKEKEHIVSIFKREQDLFNFADSIVCPSNYTKQILTNEYKIATNKIHVIYNGLTISNFEANRIELKQNLHIDEENVILFVGRLDKMKGVNVLISSFKKIISYKPNCRLIIAGGCNNMNDYMRFANDIWAKITFTGHLNKNKLSEFYQITDVGVMPSLFETFGYVALEMMGHNIPVVATDVGGLSEIVEDGITGFKINRYEIDDRVEVSETELTNKILAILDKKAEFGFNPRDRFLKYFTSDIMNANMVKWYKNQYYDNI